MRMRLAIAMAVVTVCHDAPMAAESPPPNFVVILCDNLGYGDVGCYGNRKHRTPQLDRMAAEGRRFTHFYVTSGVCTPSRASIMTGCYPRRVNMHVSDQGGSVLRPVSPKGLHPDEVTIAELVKPRGYATALIGKWHLGDQLPFLPTRQGFDYYLGIPYSDDMTQRPQRPWPPLPLMENETVIEAPVDCRDLARRYTSKTLQFIEQNRDRPFLIVLAHATPGSTAAPPASASFQGHSANGPYGDAVEEIDWSTGQVLDALRQWNLQKRTCVLFLSDNGAPRRRPPQGSNLPLGGWGYTTAEGGQRVPFIAWWPGTIPPGTVCDELATSMDLLPTVADRAGASLPEGRPIDGLTIWPLLAGRPDARSPHEAFYYYFKDRLQAVRVGPWKLYVAADHPRRRSPSSSVATSEGSALLYDVVTDPGETNNVSRMRPEIVAQLVSTAARARRALGDGDREGSVQRPAGWIDDPTPRRVDPRRKGGAGDQ